MGATLRLHLESVPLCPGSEQHKPSHSPSAPRWRESPFASRKRYAGMWVINTTDTMSDFSTAWTTALTPATPASSGRSRYGIHCRCILRNHAAPGGLCLVRNLHSHQALARQQRADHFLLSDDRLCQIH